MNPIQNYDGFVQNLLTAGFSMGGGNDEGIFALVPWSWDEVPPYETPVRWHTGLAETDPWEWRMRVLDERRDIAYGKRRMREQLLAQRDAPAGDVAAALLQDSAAWQGKQPRRDDLTFFCFRL